MGFFDKIKDTVKTIKEENRHFGSTMKRINNRNNFFGAVNHLMKEGDFWGGSYISIEGFRGVIYGSNQDDYIFTNKDIKKCSSSGIGDDIPVGNITKKTNRFIIEFNDGKVAYMDIFDEKVNTFISTFELNV